jgi:hypothetical protein
MKRLATPAAPSSVALMLLLALGLACGLTSDAQAVTAQQAIAALNAQRAANGIPADIVENPEWSQGCGLHNAYRGRNGQDPNDPHSENPALPGYTPLGDQAARGSVLTVGRPFVPGGNPWESAPYHLMWLLAPALSVTGYADGCMWAWPGLQRPTPPQPVLYTYPGDGTSSIYYQETVAGEWPSAPGDHVGLPQATEANQWRGTTTGPHIFVLPFGTGIGQLTAASLTGPAGPVPIRSVDNVTSPVPMPPGAIIIPAQHLTLATTYTASVTFEASARPPATGAVTLSKTWSFTTRPQTSPARARVHLGASTRTSVAVDGGFAVGQRASILVRALKWHCYGARCHTRPRTGAGSGTRHITLQATQRITLGCAAAYAITVTLPAFDAAGITYQPTLVRRYYLRRGTGALAPRPLGGWVAQTRPAGKALRGCR